MAQAWYMELENRLWRVDPDASGVEPPRGDEDLIPVYGKREALASQLRFNDVDLYERCGNTTNFLRVCNPERIAKVAAEWKFGSDSSVFVWLAKRQPRGNTEITGIELNEIVGAEIVQAPALHG